MRHGFQQKVFTRWSTAEAALPQGIFAIWPNFGDAQKITTQVPQFVMNLILSPLVKALGADAATAELLATATEVSGWLDDLEIIERLSVAGARLAQAYRATLDS